MEKETGIKPWAFILYPAFPTTLTPSSRLVGTKPSMV